MKIRYVTKDGITFKAVKDDMLETISEKEADIFAKAMVKILEIREVVNQIINPKP